MQKLKIAVSPSLQDSFITDYEKIDVASTDFTNVAAVVGTPEAAPALLERIAKMGFDIPFFWPWRKAPRCPKTCLPSSPACSR
ncbi:TPA: hypothetical protein ACXI93_005844 [Pseudomonas aeruginosa]